VQAQQPIVLLQDDSILEIKANIPERDLATEADQASAVELSHRLNARVSITAIPGRSFPAELTEIATAADPTTRTFEVTFSFNPDTDVRILPGMTARITVDQPTKEASSAEGFVIPANATAFDDEGNSFVWRIDTSSMLVEAVQVELSVMQGAQITVFGGLTDGDLIAVSGVHQLREGTQVRRMSEQD
jgi:RND family efflux transporter MFP subunit